MTARKTDAWMPLYIGDYLADTMSFTTEQHGAYIRLLMACWRERGQPLSGADEDMATITGLPVARWRSIKAKLLAKFEQTEGGGITHKRVQRESERALKVSEARSESGKNGAAKRWQKDGKQIANAIDEPWQNNGQSQSHITNPPSLRSGGRRASAPDRPADVDAQVWSDWLDLRKAKKAPVTATVIDAARAEAEKAGMTLEAFLRTWCARGSQGLQADWLKPHERAGPNGSNPPTSPAGKHAGFAAKNYRDGVSEDGSFH